MWSSETMETWKRDALVRRLEHGALISQNVLIKWFLSSQFTHKPVNSILVFLVMKLIDGFVGEFTSEKTFMQYVR